MKIRGATINTPLARHVVVDDSVVSRKPWSSQNTVEQLAIQENKSGNLIALDDASNLPLQGLTIYGKTTQNGTPTPDAPIDLVSVGDKGNPEVEILGKNFVKPVTTETSIEKNGVTATFRTDGSIVLNGTNTSGAFTMLFMYSRWSSPVAIKKFLKLRAGTYTFSNTSNDTTSGWSFRLQTHPYTTKYDYTVSAQNNKRTFVAETDLDVILFVGVSADATFNNVIIRPQLELGSVATDYEPYCEQIITGKTAPKTCCGIPVASGGNYTDANGQQWICDEADCARGVYVQRVCIERFDGIQPIEISGVLDNVVRVKVYSNLQASITNCLCSSLPYNNAWDSDSEHCYMDTTYNSALIFLRTDRLSSVTVEGVRDFLVRNPMDILYALATPIEYPLDEFEENEGILDAYATLHTNKPYTTVQNNANAGMKISYVADTKTYIDNKFTELQNAILATGANV